MPSWNWDDYFRQYPTWQSLLESIPGGDPMGFARSQPAAVYGLWSGYQGAGRTTPFRNWLGQQSARYGGEYQGLSMTNPYMQWYDYLDTINPSQEFRRASPYERGERPGSFVGRQRWLPTR